MLYERWNWGMWRAIYCQLGSNQLPGSWPPHNPIINANVLCIHLVCIRSLMNTYKNAACPYQWISMKIWTVASKWYCMRVMPFPTFYVFSSALWICAIWWAIYLCRGDGRVGVDVGVGGFTSHQWIPVTKGQLCKMHFHVMTSCGCHWYDYLWSWQCLDGYPWLILHQAVSPALKPCWVLQTDGGYVSMSL